MADVQTLLGRARDAFGFTEADLAELLGVSKSHVHWILTGKYAERLTSDQAARLLDACRTLRDHAVATVEELEMLT